MIGGDWMGKFIDMTGWVMKEHGVPKSLLTVIERVGSTNDNRALWRCQCECGGFTNVDTHSLTDGNTRSCGCRKYGGRLTHGEAKDGQTRLYRIWSAMKMRCNNPNNVNYYLYGGKGIKVCDAWNDFNHFRDWAINNGYSDELTIDRIDSNKDYCPSNCRWVSYKIQSNNTSRNHYVTANGKTLTISQWSDETGIPSRTIAARINVLGWEPQDAVSIPLRRKRCDK